MIFRLPTRQAAKGMLWGLTLLPFLLIAVELWWPKADIVGAVTFVDPTRYTQAADAEDTVVAVRTDTWVSFWLGRELPPVFTAITLRPGKVCRQIIARPELAVVTLQNCGPPQGSFDKILGTLAEALLSQRQRNNI